MEHFKPFEYIPQFLQKNEATMSNGNRILDWSKKYHEGQIHDWQDMVFDLRINAVNNNPVFLDIVNIKDTIERTYNLTCSMSNIAVYPDGTHGLTWHSDSVDRLVPSSSIFIVSLGQGRRMGFREKTFPSILSTSYTETEIPNSAIPLLHGDLIILPIHTQQNWEHCIYKEPKITGFRASIIFYDEIMKRNSQ